MVGKIKSGGHSKLEISENQITFHYPEKDFDENSSERNRFIRFSYRRVSRMDEWKKIPNEYCAKLINSTDRRCRSLINVRYSSTKYGTF